jgi:choice-of-anchor A domain-containing protein
MLNKSHPPISRPFVSILAVLSLSALLNPEAQAALIPLGDAADYAVLYEGTGGHNLSITNVTINGNVGVGGTGVVQYSGPGTINGRVDFSAANGGQFHNTNGSNVGPTSVNFNVATVTSALSTVDSLNSSLVGLGTSLVINGNQTVNASAGQLDTVNGVTYRVFNVTSYSENDGNLLTINGDGSGDPVVFNFGFNSNVNLGGDVALTGGLSTDQILWNFTTSGKNINLNNNASSFPLPLAFQGIILAPDDVLSMTNANLNGRFFGGDSGDMHIVSGANITAPSRVPEPGTLVLLGPALAGLALFRRRSGRR